jgi:hypothetical protein
MQARDALGELATQAQKYDTDGIEVHFFNDPRVGTGMRVSRILPTAGKLQSHATTISTQNSREVENLFNGVMPRGMTPMAGRLETLLLEYLSKLESDRSTKPVNYIVLTDGAPSEFDSLSRA